MDLTDPKRFYRSLNRVFFTLYNAFYLVRIAFFLCIRYDEDKMSVEYKFYSYMLGKYKENE